MHKNSTIHRSTVPLLFTVAAMIPTIVFADADPYTPPEGEIDTPTGNIEAHTGSANRWVTPIGGSSTWNAINLLDEDLDGCDVVEDTIPDSGIQWDINFVTFSGGSNIGNNKTITADTQPRSSVGMRLRLDDEGDPADDGDFNADWNPVASQNLDMVIPDQELHVQANPVDCAAEFPNHPYGPYTKYKGEVARKGYTLDFDHTTISETDDWPGFIQNGCNLPVPQIGGQIGLTNNRWDGVDNVRSCREVNPVYDEACTTTVQLDWRIRAPGGDWHVYHTPTYTFNVGAGQTHSQATLTRSELP